MHNVIVYLIVDKTVRVVGTGCVQFVCLDLCVRLENPCNLWREENPAVCMLIPTCLIILPCYAADFILLYN